jgi:membrane protein DedA with SNARE-associated domain
MVDSSIVETIQLIETYTYFIIFPISILEGPVISIIAGFLVSTGILKWYIAGLVLLVGDIVGDIFYYGVGRYSEEYVIKRWGHYVGITRERVNVFKSQFLNHSIKLILFSKTQPAGAAVLFAAGVARMPFSKFVLYSVVGSFPKTVLFMAAGYYLGEGILNANKYLGWGAAISTGIAILLVIFYLAIKLYIKRTSKDLQG